MASENELAPQSETQDNEHVISMVDVLREEEELEADANAVLGDSDASNCTYPLGYVNRQALYACSTCSPSEPAGICLACSYECHDGHDLYELYTKRNFCCDCGNSKFPDLKCKLFENKNSTNAKNLYNHNFKGTYCICVRPYPDPEDEIEDEMIQCIICEDWYHGRHLGTEMKPTENYEEMICINCMQKYDFLYAYQVRSKETQKVLKTETNEEVEVTDKKETADVKLNMSSDGDKSQDSVCGSESKNVKECDINKSDKNDVNGKPDGDCDSSVNEQCLLKELRTRERIQSEGSTFWENGWRKKLCRCSKCMDMYKEREITYMIDEEDTVHAYESRGKANSSASSGYDKGIQALNKMDRVQQVEVLHGFNDLKSELSEYLKKFAENGKVVREEDIREFFTTMEARKRQRTAAPMQYFCK